MPNAVRIHHRRRALEREKGEGGKDTKRERGERERWKESFRE